jgi:hypothetical protein
LGKSHSQQGATRHSRNPRRPPPNSRIWAHKPRCSGEQPISGPPAAPRPHSPRPPDARYARVEFSDPPSSRIDCSGSKSARCQRSRTTGWDLAPRNETQHRSRDPGARSLPVDPRDPPGNRSAHGHGHGSKR